MPARSGAVHVATTKRVYKGKTYVTHLLRRSIRKGKTVTHETLGNLSHLPRPPHRDHQALAQGRDLRLRLRRLPHHTLAPAWPWRRRPDDDPQAGTGGAHRLRAVAAARPGDRH